MASPALQPYVFTPEKARLAALKSHAPDSARFHPKPTPAANPNQSHQPAVPATDDFVAKTLIRVRKQMRQVQAKIDEHLAGPINDKVFKALLDAFSRLEVADQKLSGRAAPGSLRPSSKGKRERGSRAKPEIPE